MNTELTTVLVLGGSGFVGRHAVAALLCDSAKVIIGTRHPGKIDAFLPAAAIDCPQRQIMLERLVESDAWSQHIHDVDVVLNCVGILRQRGRSTYDKVHHCAPIALAKACGKFDKRLVHVSALGLHQSARSRFLTSKLAGEAGIKSSGADWIIVRPSLLDGRGGFGARWLRGVAQLPFFFAPSNAYGKIAALHVKDLGEALSRLCLASAADLNLRESRLFELGGLRDFAFRDYIRALRKDYTHTSVVCIPVPGFVARLFAHVCDALHFTPFSFGHWELLQRDNKPRVNRLEELLKQAPRAIASASAGTGARDNG